jgi:hypothetical protein
MVLEDASLPGFWPCTVPVPDMTVPRRMCEMGRCGVSFDKLLSRFLSLPKWRAGWDKVGLWLRRHTIRIRLR